MMIMTLINPTLTSEVRGIWGGQRAAMRAMQPFYTVDRGKGRKEGRVSQQRDGLTGRRDFNGAS